MQCSCLRAFIIVDKQLKIACYLRLYTFSYIILTIGAVTSFDLHCHDVATQPDIRHYTRVHCKQEPHESRLLSGHCDLHKVDFVQLPWIDLSPRVRDVNRLACIEENRCHSRRIGHRTGEEHVVRNTECKPIFMEVSEELGEINE